MPEPTILITLKFIAPYIWKYGKVGWAKLPQNRPIGKALTAASKRYDTRLPGVHSALEKWILSDDFQAQIDFLQSGADTIENDLEHVDRFMRVSGLGLGTGSLDAVGEFLNFFYSQLYLELADGEHGTRVMAAKLEAIHRDVQKGQAPPSGLETLPYRPPVEVETTNQAITEEDGKAEIELNFIKSLIDNRQGRTGLSFLVKLQQRVDRGILSAPLRFRFFVNKGVCQMLTGNLDEAIPELERARTLEPANRKALVNLAMVAVCQHRYEEALIFLQAPLNQDPQDPTANALTLASLHEMGRRDEFEQTLLDRPNLLQDPHCLYTVAYAAFDLGKFDEAEHYLQLHNQQNNALPEAWELLGRSILVPVQQLLLKTAASPNWISEDLRRRIEEAIECFTRAEELLANAESQYELSFTLANRGVARMFLFLYEDARKDYERALYLDPSLDDVKRNLGNLALVTEKPEEAVLIFNQIQSPGKRAEAAAYIAAAYLNSGNPGAARDVISPMIDYGDSTPQNFLALNVFLHASQLLNDAAGCGRILDILREIRDEPEAPRIEAEYHLRAGNSAEATRLMRVAVEAASPERVGRYRLSLADLLFRQDRFAEASEQYELVPVPSDESPESRRYVGALFAAGRYSKALQVVRVVRGDRPAIPDFSEIEARINEASGALEEANRLRRHLLEAGVTPARQKLKIALNAFRSGQTATAIDQTLQVALIEASRDAELLLDAARLRALLKLPHALDFAYALLDEELADPDFHLFYVQIFFRREEIDRNLLNPGVVVVDCVVTLKRGDEVQTVIVVADKPDIAKGRFSTDHLLVKELLGKRAGDKIRVPPEGPGVEFEIQSVQSKFVAAFQECLTRFNTRFPAHYGLTRIELDPEDITSFLPQLEARRALAERVIDLYRNARRPACTVARLLGKSDAELFRSLLHDPSTKVLSFFGDRAQMKREAESLITKKPILIETSALVTLHSLGLLDAVANALSNMRVTQQSIDALVSTSMELFPEKQTGHIFSNSPGHIGVVALTTDQVAKEKAFYDDLLNFTRTRCKVTAPDTIPSLEEFEKAGLQRTLGPAALSTIATAKGSDMLMLSDDLPLRAIAENEFGLSSVCTFAILKHLRAAEYLSDDDYHRAIQRLIDYGVVFVAIDKQDLLWVLRQNAWHPTSELASFLQTIQGPDCAEPEALQLGLEVLYDVWAEPLAASTKLLVADLIFHALTAGRNPRGVLQQLHVMNSHRSLLWTPAMEGIKDAIRGWNPHAMRNLRRAPLAE